jgi:sialate O-acetylesterase
MKMGFTFFLFFGKPVYFHLVFCRYPLAICYFQQYGSAATIQSNFMGLGRSGRKNIYYNFLEQRSDSVVATGEANWKISVNTPAAGGPYTVTLKGGNTIVLDNIMIGEVWICSGQSNMEWSSSQNLKQILDELPTAVTVTFAYFKSLKTTSTNPQDNTPGEWKVCSPESLKGFSAIGYFFGKKLQHDLNVPVGVINASWGGTRPRFGTCQPGKQ